MLKLFTPLALVVIGAVPAAGATRPNVLLVITDDRGSGDLGCHGRVIVRRSASNASFAALRRSERREVFTSSPRGGD